MFDFQRFFLFTHWESIERARNGLYEPLLQENEREAVADLLNYLENRDSNDFFGGDPLRALSTLAYSDNIDLQRSAALAFAEITEKDVRQVDRDTLEPIMYLLQSHDIEVQRASAAALGNLAVNATNKVLIVNLGGLDPLVQLTQSPNVEVQCNAVGCITNLATHDDNKSKIARSGALIPLTRLARSKDLRVQRNATGALLNMTHTLENRQQLVNAGSIPVLVSLLSSPDPDVQYYCTTGLSNLAVDAINRKRLAQTESRLVPFLIKLMSSPILKVQCQAVLALRNLASDEKFQLDIVREGGLPPLVRLIQTKVPQIVLASVACLRNISIHSANESPIVEAGFLGPLQDLLAFPNEEIQCHAVSTIRNLAASDGNKVAIAREGIVDRVGELLAEQVMRQEREAGGEGKQQTPSVTLAPSVQSEMTACLAVLALSDELKPTLMSVAHVLLPLTSSPSLEVQGNAAAALGNLASRLDIVGADFFIQRWDSIEGYLSAFLSTDDPTLQHIAIWTLLQFVEGDQTLKSKVSTSNTTLTHLRRVWESRRITMEIGEGTPEIEEVVGLCGTLMDHLSSSTTTGKGGGVAKGGGGATTTNTTDLLSGDGEAGGREVGDGGGLAGGMGSVNVFMDHVGNMSATGWSAQTQYEGFGRRGGQEGSP